MSMDYERLVETLKGMLPEKIPYGELVGAPWPYTSQGEMVYPDLEDYIIEKAAIAISDLVARVAAVEKERDIAIDQLRGKCSVCSHYSGYHNKGKCKDCCWEYSASESLREYLEDNWEWKGLSVDYGLQNTD